MITRPGMSCSDNDLTDAGMHGTCANDDGIDPWSTADLMGTSTWLDYVTRWNPLRWTPQRRGKAKRRAS